MRRDPAVSSSSGRRSTSPRSGVTFVELIVALALSAMLFGVLWTLFRNAAAGVQAWRENATMNRLFRIAMLHAREDLENATAVDEAGPGRLRFRMIESLGADGRPVVGKVDYRVEAGNLVRRTAAGESAIGERGSGLALDFSARLERREDDGLTRYEVTLALVGREGSEREDSLEIRVVPPMMAERRAIRWAPPAEEKTREEPR